MHDCMFSTGKYDWETPKKFFDELNEEFNFTLDPCCTHENAKCEKHYTIEDNGLEQDWGGETVFCNPPYSVKGRQDPWIRKCYEESLKPNTTVVALIPARTDTARFHDYIYGKAEIRFLRGRLYYEINGEPMDRPPYPSMVCIWRNEGGKENG